MQDSHIRKLVEVFIEIDKATTLEKKTEKDHFTNFRNVNFEKMLLIIIFNILTWLNLFELKRISRRTNLFKQY